MTGRRLLILASLVVVTALWPAGHAHAVIGGQPDGDAHPYVAMVVADFVCSGVAVTTTVVLTAAHCFDEPAGEAQLTFDPDARPGSGATFHEGTFVRHPGFCPGCSPPAFDENDVAVVLLDEPVGLTRYAQLPTLGFADTLSMMTKLTVVGYGVQDVLRSLDPDEVFVRTSATVRLLQTRDAFKDQYLKIRAERKASVCFGDSGGPNLLGTSDLVVALSTFVTNGECAGVAYSQRLDIPSVRTFLATFVSLP